MPCVARALVPMRLPIARMVAMKYTSQTKRENNLVFLGKSELGTSDFRFCLFNVNDAKNAFLLFLLHKVFDDTILPGMKANDAEGAARSEQIRCLRKHQRE